MLKQITAQHFWCKTRVRDSNIYIGDSSDREMGPGSWVFDYGICLTHTYMDYGIFGQGHQVLRELKITYNT